MGSSSVGMDDTAWTWALASAGRSTNVVGVAVDSAVEEVDGGRDAGRGDTCVAYGVEVEVLDSASHAVACHYC